MRERSKSERREIAAVSKKSLNFDVNDSGSSNRSYDEVRSPIKQKLPERRQNVRDKNEINRELLAIQQIALHKTPLDDDCTLNQIIQQWAGSTFETLWSD